MPSFWLKSGRFSILRFFLQDNASSVDFSPASKKATLVELKEIAYGVRKILSPFYKNKSITSKVYIFLFFLHQTLSLPMLDNIVFKDVFKDVARFLTHSCCRSMPLSESKYLFSNLRKKTRFCPTR